MVAIPAVRWPKPTINQLNKLMPAVIQEEGNERSLEWSLNDDGTLDLYTGITRYQYQDRGTNRSSSSSVGLVII